RLAPRLPWPKNVWIGVSVESTAYTWRGDYLRRVPAGVRFVSAEPLLSPLNDLDLTGIHCLVAGGESQPGARPADGTGVGNLLDQSVAPGLALSLKQLGGHPHKGGGEDAVVDVRGWVEIPIRTRSPVAPTDGLQSLC